MFITFEGPDGGGKTTQIRLLSDRLAAMGCEVVVTREPGGTPVGTLIRSLLLESDHVVSPEAEAYLMTADRAEHVRQVIQPSRRSGKFVISDRYLDSTLAYQGGGRNLSIDQLRSLQALATDGLLPDLTFLLDLPVEAGLERKFAGPEFNRMDHESLAFHTRVGETYRILARAEPERWRIIDATQAVEMVHTAIWFHVSACLDVTYAALMRSHDE